MTLSEWKPSLNWSTYWKLYSNYFYVSLIYAIVLICRLIPNYTHTYKNFNKTLWNCYEVHMHSLNNDIHWIVLQFIFYYRLSLLGHFSDFCFYANILTWHWSNDHCLWTHLNAMAKDMLNLRLNRETKFTLYSFNVQKYLIIWWFLQW